MKFDAMHVAVASASAASAEKLGVGLQVAKFRETSRGHRNRFCEIMRAERIKQAGEQFSPRAFLSQV